MYPSSTRNTLDICLFGLANSLAFRHRNLNHNTVLNRVEAEGLQRRQTPILIANFWGQHGDWASFKSQKHYMKKDIKALLSVSLPAMNVPSTTPLVVDKDMVSDAREDSDDRQSTHIDDYIPSMHGISATAFHWHG
jgi:hypothetical protein